MAQVSEIMSTEVQVVEPQESLQRAAQLMRKLDVGALPVCDGRKVLGMVTDRDITIRGVAAGLAPAEACVSDVMTERALWCTRDQDTDEVMRMMGVQQVRRLPVVDDERELVGIVSISDLVLRQSNSVDETVRDISVPGDGGAPKAAS